jgi:hypothetical protein
MLQFHSIVAVNWDKLDSARGTLTGFNATSQFPAVAPALGEQYLQLCPILVSHDWGLAGLRSVLAEVNACNRS